LTTILRKLPYLETRSTVAIRNREEPIKPHQIVLWVSLAEIEQREFSRDTPRFPAILDTGFSHNFAIREDHLIRFAGIRPAYLRKIGDIRVNNTAASLHQADVWLHRNQPGKRDAVSNTPPFCLELGHGVIVYPAGAPDAPRLPVLGLRSMKWAGLHLAIDCERCQVGLRTPWRLWLGR
jgi:hypothetical protein